jgi:ATP-binding cassette subfamily F protein 3
MSGGERTRLRCLLLMLSRANCLVLDEPTNHLDIPAREAIETFMRDSPATLLVVSHDRRLLETVCDRLWVVDDGLAVAFDAGYREWRAAVADGWTVREAATRRAARAAAPAPRTPAAAVGRSPDIGDPAPAKPALARPRQPKLSKDAYRRQKTALDAELTRLGLRKNHLELAMGDPSIAANFVELRRVTSELADVSAALATAEDAWLELEDRAP